MYLGLWGAWCQWAMYRNNRLGFSRCSDVWICLIWSDQIKQGRAWWGLCMGALGILCLENKCRLVISVCLGIRMLGVIWLYRVLGCVLQHKLSTSFSPLNAKESHNRLTPLQLPWGLNEIMHVKTLRWLVAISISCSCYNSTYRVAYKQQKFISSGV